MAFKHSCVVSFLTPAYDISIRFFAITWTASFVTLLIIGLGSIFCPCIEMSLSINAKNGASARGLDFATPSAVLANPVISRRRGKSSSDS